MLLILMNLEFLQNRHQIEPEVDDEQLEQRLVVVADVLAAVLVELLLFGYMLRCADDMLMLDPHDVGIEQLH